MRNAISSYSFEFLSFGSPSPKTPLSFSGLFVDSKTSSHLLLQEVLLSYFTPSASMREEKSSVDVEAGPHRSSSAGESDGSLCFSDAEEQSWHSPFNSNYGELRCSGASSHEIDAVEEPCRDSCISDCSSFEVDLECGEIKVNLEKTEKDCRICYLSLESRESGVPIVLGCSCKDDLAAAHKQCAETWFKIRGNK